MTISKNELRFKGKSAKTRILPHNLQKLRTKMRLELMLQSVRNF